MMMNSEAATVKHDTDDVPLRKRRRSDDDDDGDDDTSGGVSSSSSASSKDEIGATSSKVAKKRKQGQKQKAYKGKDKATLELGNSFPERLMSIIRNGSFEEAIKWSPDGRSFGVIPNAFTQKVLKVEFQGTKFESFQRKLSRWQFARCLNESFPPEAVVYRHDLFRRDKPELVFSLLSEKKKEATVKKQSKPKALPKAAGTSPTSSSPTGRLSSPLLEQQSSQAPGVCLEAELMRNSVLQHQRAGVNRMEQLLSLQNADHSILNRASALSSMGSSSAHQTFLDASSDSSALLERQQQQQLLLGQLGGGGAALGGDPTHPLLGAGGNTSNIQAQRLLQQDRTLRNDAAVSDLLLSRAFQDRQVANDQELALQRARLLAALGGSQQQQQSVLASSHYDHLRAAALLSNDVVQQQLQQQVPQRSMAADEELRRLLLAQRNIGLLSTSPGSGGTTPGAATLDLQQQLLGRQTTAAEQFLQQQQLQQQQQQQQVDRSSPSSVSAQRDALLELYLRRQQNGRGL